MKHDNMVNQAGFEPADILLPKNCDWEKWAVVACDQFTSQPDYWQKVEKFTEGGISTLNLILPELYLGKVDTEDRIKRIHSSMRDYLENNVFETYENALLYLERRQSDGRLRRGLIGKLDLECYDYKAGSKALARATEGAILERIPPRQAVRRDALLELPHAMMLIDDPENKVMNLLSPAGNPVYDFDLMEGGGHVTAYLVPQEKHGAVIECLASLKSSGGEPILFAVGDGNHSLASAKACYEEIKAQIGEKAAATHPARWALAEVVSLYDEAIDFEAIHRVMFQVDPEHVMKALREFYPDCVEGKDPAGHVIEYVSEKRRGFVTVKKSDSNLPTGTLQNFNDEYLRENSGTVDYIHDNVAAEMGAQPGCIAFLLPAIDKESFFASIVADGALPRKTFSMGHAEDKRYYLEARKIR